MSSPPGSDKQLAWVRALAAVATSDDDLGLLRGLLSGDREIDGLGVDVELRWALLHRLVVVGAAGDAEIDAELKRDATAAGERHAALVRAARPTAAAKAEAWAALVEFDTLPNALQRATVVGFQQPDHRQLLEPYVEKYFAAVQSVWASRTPEMAQELIVGLFPALHVSQQTVDRADEWLATESAEATLRRMIVEGRDGLARALRARACDGAS
jgi:aminopeptidase N